MVSPWPPGSACASVRGRAFGATINRSNAVPASETVIGRRRRSPRLRPGAG